MDYVDRIINESINRFLMLEYYGIPSNIEGLAREIMDNVKERWVNGNFERFTITDYFITGGLIMIWPTEPSDNVRAAYTPINNKILYPLIWINPECINEEPDENGSMLYASLIHELTHMYEDVKRYTKGFGGMQGEMNRIGHDLAYKKVITQGATLRDNTKYTPVQKAAYKVVYYFTSFEKNARNAAMYAKLKDAYSKGMIKNYKEAFKFIQSTTEYQRYENTIASAYHLLSLKEEWKQLQALRAAFIASNHNIMTWKLFRKWLKNNIVRYERKMNEIVPKMIAYVMDGNNRLTADER